jgi:hypothetical protein
LPFACLIAFVSAAIADEDHFRDTIAPLLQQRCLSCHNSIDRKGDFSLQSAAELSDSGFVTPGDPDDSYLLETLVGTDDQPPSMPKEGQPLTAEQVAAISAWIKTGAIWPNDLELTEPAINDLDWWSLQPLQRPPVPQFDVSHRYADWVRSPIDAFILQQFDAKQLAPSAAADRRTLIRRVTYDLIGLPPTPTEVADFLADQRPDAYERLVERLLSSPHYGERWARHWLDVVRYADTCGYDKDKLRPNAWPYRDYVVRAFNEDKPYWRFVQEQIAGDAIFPGESDGILGLGFIAAGPWDFIGHVEVPESKLDGQEARNLDRDEMVSSTMNTFCSTTVQCARCHNHKFDPITQEHYYSLQAIFAAVDRAERVYDLDPKTERRRAELQSLVQESQQQLQQLNTELQTAGGTELTEFDAAITRLQQRAIPQAKRPEYGYHSAIATNPEMEKWVQVDLGSPQEISRIVLRACHDEFAGIGAGFGFPVRFRVNIAETESSFENPADQSMAANILVADRTQQDFPNPGLAAVEFKIEQPVQARFIRVTTTRLALRQDDFMLALAELQAFDDAGNNLAANAGVTALDSIEAPVRWRKSNLTDGIWPASADPQAIEDLAETVQRRTELLKRIQTPEWMARQTELEQQLKSATTELNALPQGKLVYAAATDFSPQGNFQPTRGKPRTVRLLHRGNVNQPLHEVTPGTIPILPGVDWRFALSEDHSEAQRRAALARWITRDDHPLTWRSIVNRVWQYHFGSGIVASANDFGKMGQLPSHPDLLDWLAVEFRDGGQSFRNLHRLIVTSAVYRQSSADNQIHSAIDANNRFLWRMNRRRLEAEEIRDSILAVSGRLDRKMGGPGFYLFVLEKTEHSPHYEYHLFDPGDPASHRRSLYRFVVRSQPDPWMTTLDCADSSQSTPRRDETLTALQALSLLNNQFNLVMAQHFANRLSAESDALSEQILRAMQLITGREPTDEETQRFTEYASEHGLTNLCRVMLNLSEFVYID